MLDSRGHFFSLAAVVRLSSVSFCNKDTSRFLLESSKIFFVYCVGSAKVTGLPKTQRDNMRLLDFKTWL
jgi:hypothetical protein